MENGIKKKKVNCKYDMNVRSNIISEEPVLVDLMI
jgi:hypothetical protein